MKKILIFSLLLCLQHDPLSAMKRSQDHAEINNHILQQEVQVREIARKKELFSSLNTSNFYNTPLSSLSTPPLYHSMDTNEIPCGNCGKLFTTLSSCRIHEMRCKQKSLEIERLKVLFQAVPLQKEKHENPPIKKRKIEVKIEQSNKNICSVCKKRLSTSSSLKNHMMLHTGERPYKCHRCSKDFIQSSNFKKHVSYCTKTAKEKPLNNNDLNELFNKKDLSEWLGCL